MCFIKSRLDLYFPDNLAFYFICIGFVESNHSLVRLSFEEEKARNDWNV